MSRRRRRRYLRPDNGKDPSTPATAGQKNGEGEGDVIEASDLDPTVQPDDVMAMVHAPMGKAMSGAGITPDYLAERLKEELDANETKIFFDQRTGKLIYSKDLVCWKVRSEARKDSHKLLGHYPPERRELSGPAGMPLDLRVGPEVQQVIQQIEILVMGTDEPAPVQGEVIDV